jgi:hypothetical protein
MSATPSAAPTHQSAYLQNPVRYAWQTGAVIVVLGGAMRLAVSAATIVNCFADRDHLRTPNSGCEVSADWAMIGWAYVLSRGHRGRSWRFDYACGIL